jgi:hypothetical protein
MQNQAPASPSASLWRPKEGRHHWNDSILYEIHNVILFFPDNIELLSLIQSKNGLSILLKK